MWVDPFHGNGTIIIESDDYCVWECEVEPGVVALCTQKWVEPLFERNAQLLNDSAGKRFGDGKIVASIDLPTYFAKILPAQKAGDRQWIKRFLNDSENRKYRTFRGNI